MGLYKLILLTLSTAYTALAVICGLHLAQHPYGKLCIEHMYSKEFIQSPFFQAHTMYMMVFYLAFGALNCIIPANASTARAGFMVCSFGLGSYVYMHFVVAPGTIPNIFTKETFQGFLGLLAFMTLVNFYYGFVQRSPKTEAKEKRH